MNDEINSDEVQFSRRTVVSQPSDNTKQIIERIAKKLDTELGRQATLEDFINSRIEKHTYEQVDDLFDAFTNAWSAIGRDISGAEKIYEDLFNQHITLEREMFKITSNITEEKAQESVTKVETKLQEITTDNNSFSTNKIINEEFKTTENSDLKIKNYIMERSWLRWLLLVPCAIGAAIISGFILEWLNRIGIGRYLDREGFLYGIFGNTIINSISGFIYIYTAIYLAPKHKKNVSIILIIASTVILFLGTYSEIKFNKVPDYWGLYGYLIFIISQYYTYKHFKEKKFETSLDY